MFTIYSLWGEALFVEGEDISKFFREIRMKLILSTTKIEIHIDLEKTEDKIFRLDKKKRIYASITI